MEVRDEACLSALRCMSSVLHRFSAPTVLRCCWFGLQPQEPATGPVSSDPGHGVVEAVVGHGVEGSDAAFADSLRLIHIQKMERASLRSRKDQVCVCGWVGGGWVDGRGEWCACGLLIFVPL